MLTDEQKKIVEGFKPVMRDNDYAELGGETWRIWVSK